MGLVRKRIFGSDVDLKVKQKIKNLQKLAEGSPEALESKDIEIIKKLMRDVISDVYRDIWIKRNSWK